MYLNGHVDYVSNIDPPSFPDGLDVEVFNRQSLDAAKFSSQTEFDREHVTPFIRKGKFTKQK